MARLTRKRLENSGAVLLKYRSELFARRRFSTTHFEQDLRDLWNIESQDLKPIMSDLLLRERFREVAAYYMEHEFAGRIDAEFQSDLVNLYQARSYENADFVQKRDEYWARVFDAPRREGG